MRRSVPLLALLVAASPAPGAPDDAGVPISRRETAAVVAPLFQALRTRGIGPRAAAPGPRRLYVVVPALTPSRRAALEAAGLAIELPPADAPAAAWLGGEVVQGVADAAGEAHLRALDFVLAVREPGVAWTNVGAVTSAGDAVLGADVARAVLGLDGAGVAVGVVSDGIGGAAESAASGDLPPAVEVPVIPGVSSGSGSEGTAMLEIVHDVAPGARLLFASPRTSLEMVAAIDGLAALGAQVIVDDLVFTDEPKFEDGPIAAAARRFATGGGVYVTAAGNFGRSHYFAPYRRGAGGRFADVDYTGLHRFGPEDVGNALRIPPGVEILVVLQWNEPFGGAAKDFDLLLASASDVLLAGSAEVQDGQGVPFEAVRFVNAGTAAVDAYLAIGEFGAVAAPDAVRLNLVVFGRVGVPLEHAVRRESVFGHAAVEEVLSVAAAAAGNPSAVEDFSSAGPASIFFPSFQSRLVPRLTAVHDVETAVGRRGQFSNPFRGTSAAAPHVAGCAALLLAGGAAPPAAIAALSAAARDLGTPGADPTAGAGLLDCAAAARLASGRAAPPVVAAVAAAFDAGAAVAVQATGEDPDGDVRRATVRLLAGDGVEVARQEAAPAAAGTGFSVSVAFRGPTLARARIATVTVSDATGLSSAEAQTSFACPLERSLGGALCALGDLIEDGRALPPRTEARFRRTARSAAATLTRAGGAAAAGRTREVRRALRRAAARVRRLERLVRRARIEEPLRAAILGAADALETELHALRAGFT